MRTLLLGLFMTSAAATPSAIQNPPDGYTEYCTDPAKTAEMHFERLCDEMRGVVRIELFGEDQSAVVTKRHAVDWAVEGRKWNTKPYVPYALSVGTGDQVISLGDVRDFSDAFGGAANDILMAVRVNGKDNIVLFCDRGRCLTDEVGFTVIPPSATTFTIEGLPGYPVTLDIALLQITRRSATTEPIPDCSGNLDATGQTYTCGDTTLTLIEYRVYKIGPWATSRSTLGPK